MILKKRAGKKRIKKIYYKYRKDMYHYLICNIYIYIYDCNLEYVCICFQDSNRKLYNVRKIRFEISLLYGRHTSNLATNPASHVQLESII